MNENKKLPSKGAAEDLLDFISETKTKKVAFSINNYP